MDKIRPLSFVKLSSFENELYEAALSGVPSVGAQYLLTQTLQRMLRGTSRWYGALWYPQR